MSSSFKAEQSIWTQTWHQLKKSKFAMWGMAFISLVFLMAVLSLLGLTPYDHTEQNILNLTAEMSSDHWFGTDDLGRDLFSRVMYGSIISLSVGFGAILISLVIGLVFGSAAGYYGGWWDHLLMRLTDIFLALPTVLFAMAILAVFEQPSIEMLILVLGFLGWPGIARLVRAKILTVKEEEYVQAARALGYNAPRILIRHVLPNSMAPIMVAATIGIASNILSEAWLSFLGIGIPPPAPSWGRMISEGQAYLSTKPWVCIFPGLAIFFTVIAFNLFGDGLRDALDPRLKT